MLKILAYLENGTYERIVAQLKNELESSGLETDRKVPIFTRATTTTTVNKYTQLQKAEQQQFICRYCQQPGHVIKECRKRNRKEHQLQG